MVRAHTHRHTYVVTKMAPAVAAIVVFVFALSALLHAVVLAAAASVLECSRLSFFKRCLLLVLQLLSSNFAHNYRYRNIETVAELCALFNKYSYVYVYLFISHTVAAACCCFCCCFVFCCLSVLFICLFVDSTIVVVVVVLLIQYDLFLLSTTNFILFFFFCAIPLWTCWGYRARSLSLND